MMFSGVQRQVLSKTITLPQGLASKEFEEKVKIDGKGNLRLALVSRRSGKWSYVKGRIYKDSGGKTINQPFTVAVQQKHGGPRSGRTKYISGLPAGEYSVVMSFKWQDMTSQSETVTLKIHEGVPRTGRLIWLFFWLSVIPIGVMIYHGIFEGNRWSDSAFSQL